MPSLTHSFSVEHAEKYGIECAILIHHFTFWIEQNQALGRNFYDGRTWMYQTLREIAACYPYWGEAAVFRIIKKLIDFGVLVKGNYNKKKFDQTAWYAFKNEKMFTILRNRKMQISDSKNGDFESEIPIPDTKTDTKQITTTAAAPPAAVHHEKTNQEPKKIPKNLEVLDIPKQDKIEIANRYDEKTINDAIDWATHPLNPPSKCLAASIKYGCKKQLSAKEFNKKKETPYEMVRRLFSNGAFYNGAECFLNKEAIAFQRGFRNECVKFNQFFSWNKVQDLCASFQIPLPGMG